MKKNQRKDLFHRESINLANFKIKNSPSQHEAYQPKFIFEFLNSNQNSLELKSNNQSKKKDTGRVFRQFDTSNIQNMGYSQTTTNEEKKTKQQVQKLKDELSFERQKHRQAANEFLRQNQQLQSTIKSLEKSLKEKQKEYTDLKSSLNEIQQEFFKTKQEILKLSKENQQQVNTNANLRKKLQISQQSIKTLRENRESKISTNTIIQSPNIFQDIESYIKQQSQNFISQMKNFRMNSKLEQIIENFLQELLHINSVTLKNFRRKKNSNENMLQEFSQEYSIVQRERIKLDKSIQKLKSIDKQDRNNLTTSHNFVVKPCDRSMVTNVNLNVSSIGVKERDRDRSKSRRKIFQ